MPTKIQLKRGLKQNLPILSEGEPAFTTDTKEFYIGNGTENFNMSPSGQNIIVNGNFQISLTEEDGAYPTRVVTPGTGMYIYGNFYISNDISATGDITITRTFTNGFITLDCTDAIPTLEYRERISRYKSGASTYDWVQSNLNQYFTLSYDASNDTNTDVTVKCGIPTSLSDLIIPSVNKRISHTFQLSYYPNGYMSIVLLNMASSFTGSFTVGNFKLEQGLYSSKYTPNAAIYDLACLNQVYQGFTTYQLPFSQTTDYLHFYVPNQILFPYGDSYTITLSNVTIVELPSMSPQTGFTNTASIDPTYGLIEISCYKQNHGLTEAAAYIQGYMDFRP